LERLEEARARMVELFPDGFEEVEHADGVELAAYTDPAGEEQLWHAFGTARGRDVPGGWEDAWRRFHEPVRVGGLWIGPPWLEPDADATAVVIDPGRAFGTGGHPTTRLCIELLQSVAPGSLLDVGCGSGVLAIAAAKLGFAPVVAVDTEEAAVNATLANAERNDVEVAAHRLDALESELPELDVVVANVTFAADERVLARAQAHTAILSGYLEHESPHSPAWRHVDRRLDGGWAADLYVRG
jgi:ribosomal protein L11 methyltransferase